MNVLCLIRQVPDAEARLRISNGCVDLSEATLIIDGMDEYGVEEALKLREAGHDLEIVALSVGPKEDALRSALAMGADRAIHIETAETLDPIALSQVVAWVAREERTELIFTGGQQADWDSQALGAAVAERLDWPQLTWTTQLSIEGPHLTGRHDTDQGSERFKTAWPAVITTQQGLNEPRYITLPNIMKAKKKELRKDNLERFNVQPKLRIVSCDIQTRARLGKLLDGKDPVLATRQLMDLLKNDAKVVR